MPVVLRIDGFTVVIWPNDHLPPHVHVMGKGWEVVVSLNPAITVRQNKRGTPRDVATAQDVVSTNRTALLEEWRRIHG